MSEPREYTKELINLLKEEFTKFEVYSVSENSKFNEDSYTLLKVVSIN